MLALGGVDGLVRLMVKGPAGDFTTACELRGHGDWVRSVAFSWAGPESPQGTSCRCSSHLPHPPPIPHPPAPPFTLLSTIADIFENASGRAFPCQRKVLWYQARAVALAF